MKRLAKEWGPALWDLFFLWYFTYRTLVLVHDDSLLWASVMAVGGLIALLNVSTHRRAKP